MALTAQCTRPGKATKSPMLSPFASPAEWELYLTEELHECFGAEVIETLEEGALGMWRVGFHALHVGVLRHFVQRQWIEDMRRADKRYAKLTRHGLRALEEMRDGD